MKFEYIYESKTNTTIYYPNTSKDAYKLLKLLTKQGMYVKTITTIRSFSKDYKVYMMSNGDEIKFYE